MPKIVIKNQRRLKFLESTSSEATTAVYCSSFLKSRGFEGNRASILGYLHLQFFIVGILPAMTEGAVANRLSSILVCTLNLPRCDSSASGPLWRYRHLRRSTLEYARGGPEPEGRELLPHDHAGDRVKIC